MNEILPQNDSYTKLYSHELGDEESLPLYEPSTPLKLTPPDAKATPNEVREFLEKVLIENRGLEPGHAKHMAAKWTIGTGRDLLKYPIAMYTEIFGLEAGWMVYKEVKLAEAVGKLDKPAHETSLGGLVLVTILEGFLVMLTVLVSRSPVKTFLIVMSAIGGIIWIFCLIGCIADSMGERQEERKVDMDAQRARCEDKIERILLKEIARRERESG
ncbi:hypothetical protein AUEXF2481DRAFT_42249 [Aureobasidium subglaciale EXF-2481]|uniref:Uncharacterized protein n=1 Tax=Aureobasidium subglaciale (strain EXF-2481) TaxID=1043005 RepID=A0A074YG46_AURSE|nr:uncharacterized protein AUEXF2481DRAFT_42249 [Aureobasidium subglaciale EXF-2481]KEQ93047.1 hypothetical protein AUEXF2481DRAFT_42249 [Aureobasidium subglaciale EXF-2481]